MQFPHYYPVTCHTDHVTTGTTFVAIKGYLKNGLEYVPLALERGATSIVVDERETISVELYDLIARYNAQLVYVADTRVALAQLSAQAAGNPARQLRIIGITGTKGKTTSAFILEHVLRTAGYRTALLGTVKNSIGDYSFNAQLTTQQPDYLHQFFKLCIEQQVEYVVMEVAAQALTLHRVHGIEFDGILMTNFSQEHAEFYQSLNHYFDAKCLIFDHSKPQAAVAINSDDIWCQKIIKNNSLYGSFALNTEADYQAYGLKSSHAGVEFYVRHNNNEQLIISPTLMGAFNIYNLLGVYALAHKLGIAPFTIAEAFAAFSRVPGRLERHLLPNGALCIIDYAHNPSSFESVLSTLRSLTQHLIVVFGCGGERDATKRPLMGSIAARYADLVVLTADNPRSEDPAVIVDAIMEGIGDKSKVAALLDRKKAIEYAVQQSIQGSIVALLGKGPDEYQIVGTVKTYFSEATIIRGLDYKAEQQSPTT